MTENDIRAFITKKAIVTGGIAALSRELGVSNGYLADIMNKRRPPGGRVLDALGIEKIVTYRRRNGT